MTGSFGIWLRGLRSGLVTFRREPVLGLKRILLPASYWRTAEFAYVWNHLCQPRNAHVLDLGSPKDLAAFLARDAGCWVVATDILPEAVSLSERYAAAQGLAGSGPGRVTSEVQDGRALPYADNSFDAAFSVSVLEHIPERGDVAAMRELVRVTRPGGRIVVTTPFDRAYRETFVDGPVYERRSVAGQQVFFERHYDKQTLAERLLSVSGVRVVDLQLWTERLFPVERFLGRLGPARALVSPLEAALAASCLRVAKADDETPPKAAFFTLQKLPA